MMRAAMSGLAIPFKSPKIRVALVGATGLVGRELLRLIETRKFPISSLALFSSGQKRESLLFKNESILIQPLNFPALKNTDLVFFASSDEVSKRWAPKLSARGIWVIDDSSAFRTDPRVPLIIPEINADALSPNHRLIAGPNCTMTGLAVAGHILHKKIGISEVRLASYQAISGAGRAALIEFFKDSRHELGELSLKSGRVPVLKEKFSRALPAQIFANVFPQVGSFDLNGNSSEEIKVVAELRKVWASPKLKVSVTAVRVPTLRGHCLAAWLTLKKPVSLKRAEKMISSSAMLWKNGRYPTPLSCGGKEGVFVARLRRGCSPHEIVLWIAMDNLLKGAALNSIQIAEEILRRGWLA
jgi:aspartate-semialdehyde dehydrogenase